MKDIEIHNNLDDQSRLEGRAADRSAVIGLMVRVLACLPGVIDGAREAVINLLEEGLAPGGRPERER